MKNKSEHKQNLILLSKSVKPLVDAGQFETVNEAIVAVYKQQNAEITEFKTFVEWKKAGFKVKKGEKAFPIWGRKIKTQRKIETDGIEEDKEFKFFPVCYLFNNNQVEKAI